MRPGPGFGALSCLLIEHHLLEHPELQCFFQVIHSSRAMGSTKVTSFTTAGCPLSSLPCPPPPPSFLFSSSPTLSLPSLPLSLHNLPSPSTSPSTSISSSLIFLHVLPCCCNVCAAKIFSTCWARSFISASFNKSMSVVQVAGCLPLPTSHSLIICVQQSMGLKGCSLAMQSRVCPVSSKSK